MLARAPAGSASLSCEWLAPHISRHAGNDSLHAADLVRPEPRRLGDVNVECNRILAPSLSSEQLSRFGADESLREGLTRLPIPLPAQYETWQNRQLLPRAAAKKEKQMKNDMELQRDVQEELIWEPSVNAAGIGVFAKDGAVTIKGE